MPRRKRVILSSKDIHYISKNLNYCSLVWKLYFSTLIHTGARMSEVLRLKWSDIDITLNKITFYKTKNGDNRTIQISKEITRMYKELYEDSICTTYIFADKKGKRKSRHQVQRFLAKFKEKHPIKYKDWSCHDLRHSFAYNFLKNKGEMYQLKSILGHKSIRMTIDLYGNLQSSTLENISPYNI
ncbi:tyrosine-type recombinase/integrase [Halobacteriovorax vibrionivorans]|nr:MULTISPECIES: site-specific integrase [Halobacteriovorax]